MSFGKITKVSTTGAAVVRSQTQEAGGFAIHGNHPLSGVTEVCGDVCLSADTASIPLLWETSHSACLIFLAH